MRIQGIWTTSNAPEVLDWCERNIEYSSYELVYGGRVLAFYPRDEGEEVLFRLRWGHLIAW